MSCEEVILDKLTGSVTPFHGFLLAFENPVRIDVYSNKGNAVFLRRGDDKTAITAAKFID